MSDRQWPVTKLGTAWLAYHPEDGWSEFDNPADAEACFGQIVDHLRDEASDGWHESADTAAWGIWIPIERLRLVATAWPDDDTEDGERCRDAGWDAFLSGNSEKVEIDAAAIEFCVRREAAAFSAMREQVEALEAKCDALRAGVARLRAIPRGCLDYLGGYGGRDLDIYHHGIGTVIAAMDHATIAPDFQTRVVEALGSERENERNRAALSGSISALRSIADGSVGAVAAREFLAWFDGDRLGVDHG